MAKLLIALIAMVMHQQAIMCVGAPLTSGTYVLQQKVNMRYLDAYTDAGHAPWYTIAHDYGVVMRLAQHDDSQNWIITNIGHGSYTIQQKVNMRYLDAYFGTNYDNNGNNPFKLFRAVTRPAQHDDSQKWMIKESGDGVYTIQQKANMRYLDAYEDNSRNSICYWSPPTCFHNDYMAITRTAQHDDSQQWVITKTIDTSEAKVARNKMQTATDNVAYVRSDSTDFAVNETRSSSEMFLLSLGAIFGASLGVCIVVAFFKAGMIPQGRGREPLLATME